MFLGLHYICIVLQFCISLVLCSPKKLCVLRKALHSPGNFVFLAKHWHSFTKLLRFPEKLCSSLEKDVWPSSAQHNEITTTQRIGLISLCCANFVVLWIVSFVLLACFRYFATLLFFVVVACFHCLVLILLCCGYFPLCWANFIVLCSVHYWAKSTSLKRNFTSFCERIK